MDRLTQLRGEAGGSGNSALDTSAAPSEAYLTANESSKYFSLTEDDASFDITPTKDVSLASTPQTDKTNTGNDQLISNLSPIAKKRDLLGGYKIGKQIEAANILSGGVDIFDDNDNSYDGDELVIDDNAEIDDKSNPELKLIENTQLPLQKTEEVAECLDSDPAIGSKDSEVVLQIDGKNVNAIDIGNGLYLYRKAGEEELAAVQIVDDDQDQPSFKFLKVRENAEGNLEVYEEIEVEVPKEVPTKDEKIEKITSHVPIKDINKVISDPVCNQGAERKLPQQEIKPIASTSDNDESHKVALSETNLNGKMMKYNETRKSPVIHSTPNKEGIPLTKTMVDMQLHPSRPLDKVKTIEVHTDNIKQKMTDTLQRKELMEDHKDFNSSKDTEKPLMTLDVDKENKTVEEKIGDEPSSKEGDTANEICTKAVECLETEHISDTSTTDYDLKDDEHAEKKICANVPKVPPKLNDNVENENVGKSSEMIKNIVKAESTIQNTINSSMNEKEAKRESVSEKKIDKDSDKKFYTEKPSLNDPCLKVSQSTSDMFDTTKEKVPRTAEIKSTLNKPGSIISTKTVNISDENREKGAKLLPDQKSIINKQKSPVPSKVFDASNTITNKDTKVPTDQKANLKGQDLKLSPASLCMNMPKIINTNENEPKVPIKQKPSMNRQDLNTPDTDLGIPDALKEKIVKVPLEQKPNLKGQDLKVCAETTTKLLIKESPKETLHLSKIRDVTAKEKVNMDVDKVIGNEHCMEKKSTTSIQNPVQSHKKDEMLIKSFETDNRVSIVKHPENLPDKKSGSGVLNIDQQNMTRESDKRTLEIKSHIEMKKPEHTEAELLGNKNTVMGKTKISDQGKPILPNIVKSTSIFEVMQSNVNKPIVNFMESVATSKPGIEQLVKNDSKLQESYQSSYITKKLNQSKTELKTDKMPVSTPMGPQKKPDIIKITSTTVEKKPIINNNAAVPFGQWTSANRQEFLNKIKEHKIPINVSNTKSISKPNDLNRRDVLQKIDSQRQSSNAASKNQESAKLNIKNETPTFTNKPSACQAITVMLESKTPLKADLKSNALLPKKVEKPASGETSHITSLTSTVTSSTTCMTKSEGTNRNEFNNQDLIDKTVEGIINRAVSTKQQESKPKMPKDTKKTQSAFPTNVKSKDSKSDFDAIEMQMNELHGIPFVERPPHELPKIYKSEIKTYAKADTTKLTHKVSQIPNLLPVNKNQQKVLKHDVIDLDSEDEVIEHEPITGDIDLHKSIQSITSIETNVAQIGSDSSKKESIITERDFDKFVRRNSITYENCLTVNLEMNKNRNVVQALVQKDTNDPNEKKGKPEASPKQKSVSPTYHPNKIHITSKLIPVGEDTLNKNYQSKLQLAYQTALTTKRQMETPVTILEDKPVKVVFMDSNTNFPASQLNAQGPNLSPSKKILVPKEADGINVSTCDSIEPEIIDSVEDLKPLEETKCNKTKHQRKQVLTSVETPELELIVPGDLGIDVSPKKKRRIDDFKADKASRNLVPKKSYLLGRNTDIENPAPQDSTKESPKQIDTASAIDNLVKAAELIENQSGTFKVNTDIATSGGASPITPVKRGRGRPRKYPLPDGTQDNTKAPSPQKKPRLIKEKVQRQSASDDYNSDDSDADGRVRENWTMGKINENIVCPICDKLFRSENVVFKHVKHCTGPSPNRSDSDKRSSRRSRMSYDSKSMDSKLDDTDGESDNVISKKSASKKRSSKELGSDRKEDIIVIEDTPVKSKAERSVEPKQHESRKPTKTKAQYKVSALSCEYCGKTFRQESYLVNHKLLHKEPEPKNEAPPVTDKSVLSCEVCKKVFRKLHHLVQHRIIHNPNVMPKYSRKSSSDQEIENKLSKNKETKQTEDQSAAFRCEPCDKSFRKLHHLVEHRETHDGINKKVIPILQTTETVVQNPPPQWVEPPQCDICEKSFRKLHHLIEHKEQHHKTNSEKSDNRSVKSALSTKDIIHECSLCYMVFPNEHSLNKHSVFCQKKKRQSVKQPKQLDQIDEEGDDAPTTVKENTALEPPVSKADDIIDETTSKNVIENSENRPTDVVKTDNVPETKEYSLKENLVELPVVCDKSNSEKSNISPVKISQPEIPQKTDEKTEIELDNITKSSIKKSPGKGVSATKRRKSNIALAHIKTTRAVESSDDDDVRYMLNPDYKPSPIKPDTDTSEGRLFMEIRAKKRNSLQFERPTSKELAKRRTSLQNPAKVPRLKAKLAATPPPPPQSNISKPSKLESTDSDDSDVKYSFPDKVPEPEKPKEKRKSVSEKVHRTVEPERMHQEKKKTLANKRKMLSGIARRKSLGTTALVKQKEKTLPSMEIKRRRGEVEHRCDCGQLFSSAALLSRHTSLAHTPPRVRRRRTASPPPSPPPPPPPAKPNNSRKSSVRSETDNTALTKTKLGGPPGKAVRTPVRKSIKGDTSNASSGVQSLRKSAAHRGVPVPEKMQKVIEKLKK